MRYLSAKITDADFIAVLKHAVRAFNTQSRVLDEVLFTEEGGFIDPLSDKTTVHSTELLSIMNACERMSAILRMIHIATRNHYLLKGHGESVISPSDLEDIRNYIDNAKSKP